MGNCSERPSRSKPTPVVRFADPVTATSTDASTVSVTAKAVSERIDAQLLEDKKADDKIMKLLLLGPAESGKSTVLKQLKQVQAGSPTKIIFRIIYLNGYSKQELLAQRSAIYHNVVDCSLHLLKGVRQMGLTLPSEFLVHANVLASCANTDLRSLDENVYCSVKALWGSDVLQEAYRRRSEFGLLDCAKYFLDELDRLYDVEYCPTDKDILNARITTRGVHELHYMYDNKQFRIIDVGGQRSERRKWISVFDNVNAIFFIAALSDYDQVMREDPDTNRLIDAMELFGQIGNNPVFERTHIILFLNKKDLFAEKIVHTKLTVCLPNYKYKNDYKNATAHISAKFRTRITDPERNIYTHLTCATDTGQIQFLTNSVTDMIIADLCKRTGTT
ncbi:guanine nucleotide-binding protein alpha-7 subunit [Aphelenchoides avenae]|nr:guanine nucleotide-binding protein alpha-7 subunit [Aphelenchus avenae]